MTAMKYVTFKSSIIIFFPVIIRVLKLTFLYYFTSSIVTETLSDDSSNVTETLSDNSFQLLEKVRRRLSKIRIISFFSVDSELADDFSFFCSVKSESVEILLFLFRRVGKCVCFVPSSRITFVFFWSVESENVCFYYIFSTFTRFLVTFTKFLVGKSPGVCCCFFALSIWCWRSIF